MSFDARVPRFEDPRSEVVWVGIMVLEPVGQFGILRELATLYASVAVPTTKRDRVRRAVAALYEAYFILQHSPSVAQYRHLREVSDLKLPADGDIRRWLGGGWDVCLTRAGLPALGDGDFAARPSGTTNKFSDDDVFCALRDCAHDLGHPPTQGEYFQWVVRPDVLERPGRRPRSYHPFERFGGLRGSLLAAGVIDQTEARHTVDGRLMPLRYAFSEQELIDALTEVAKRLGHSPRRSEYQRLRAEIHHRLAARSELQPLPSADTIRKAFGSWNAALTAAGLVPVETREPPFTNGKRPSYTAEAKLGWLSRAWRELGEPFTSTAYVRWRRDRAAKGLEAGPSLTSIARTFGTWSEAARRARPADPDDPPNAHDHG